MPHIRAEVGLARIKESRAASFRLNMLTAIMIKKTKTHMICSRTLIPSDSSLIPMDAKNGSQICTRQSSAIVIT